MQFRAPAWVVTMWRQCFSFTLERASPRQRLGIWLLSVAFPSSLILEGCECMFSFLSLGSRQLVLSFLEEERRTHMQWLMIMWMSLNKRSRMLYYFHVQSENSVVCKYLKLYIRPRQK